MRGFRYDEKTLAPHVSILFPIKWTTTILTNKNLILETAVLNELSKAIIVGFKGDVNDDGIDYLFEKIEEEIKYNQEREKKQELFKEKLKELEKFVNISSLEDVKNLQIMTQDMITDEIISQTPIIEEIESSNVINNTVLIEPIIELVDDEIKYNPSLELPSMPGIIDDMNNYMED